jgi:hypothetical protein
LSGAGVDSQPNSGIVSTDALKRMSDAVVRRHLGGAVGDALRTDGKIFS